MSFWVFDTFKTNVSNKDWVKFKPNTSSKLLQLRTADLRLPKIFFSFKDRVNPVQLSYKKFIIIQLVSEILSISKISASFSLGWGEFNPKEKCPLEKNPSLKQINSVIVSVFIIILLKVLVELFFSNIYLRCLNKQKVIGTNGNEIRQRFKNVRMYFNSAYAVFLSMCPSMHYWIFVIPDYLILFSLLWSVTIVCTLCNKKLPISGYLIVENSSVVVVLLPILLHLSMIFLFLSSVQILVAKEEINFKTVITRIIVTNIPQR